MPYLDRTARIRREYDENMARIREEARYGGTIRMHDTVRGKNLKFCRKIRKLHVEEQWKGKVKFVPHAGWNFASTPTDRENTIENSQNSQFCSIQGSHGRKKINENS